jgi:uncharacterized membrane protein
MQGRHRLIQTRLPGIKHFRTLTERLKPGEITRIILEVLQNRNLSRFVKEMGRTLLLNVSKDSAYAGTRRRLTQAAIIALTLITFALRLYRLDCFSLRGDEAFDVLFASQSWGELFYQFRFVQPYPPLFHTGLHFWLPVAGQSEVAIRFWAVLCATLVVPATYALGSQLFNREVGLVSGSLAMVNPFIHWWGQDAHFYAYLVALTAVLNLVALRFWQSAEHSQSSLGDKSKRHKVLSGLYVLVALFSFLTHYFAYFTWGALNVAAIVGTLRRRWSWQLIRRWWSAQTLLMILYLPWVVFTMPITSTYVEPWIEQVTPWEILWRDLVAFSLGYTSPFPLGDLGGHPTSAVVTPWLAGFFAVIFTVGIVLGWTRPTYRPGLVITLSLTFVPLAVIYFASFHRPIFDEKLTIFLLPLYLVLLSLGIVELARRWRWIGCLVGLAAFLIMSFANYQYFANEDLAKSPAWREMFGYIHQKAQPGDLLVYNFPEPSLLYYNNERLPTALIPDSPKLSADEISAQLEQAIAGYTHIWLVPLVRPWWDARGDVLTWLDRHADRVDQRFFRGVHLNLYLTPSAWQAAMTPQPATFADGIRLHGFRLSGDRVPSTGWAASAGWAASPWEKAGTRRRKGSNKLMLLPGDTLYLSLYWQASSPTDTPYTVFTHLVGPDCQLYGQWDNAPVRGTYPPTDWSPGESVVDQYEIPVSASPPPGDYHLLIGLYDPVTGIRLSVLDNSGKPEDDHVRLEQEIIVQ